MIICILLSFCACSVNPDNMGNDSASEKKSPEATIPSDAEKAHLANGYEDPSISYPNNRNRVIVHIDPILYEEYDPNTKEDLIMLFAYDSAHVFLDDAATAAKINKVLGKMDDDYYSGSTDDDSLAYGYQDLLSEAEDLYTFFYDSGSEGTDMVLTAQRSLDEIKASDSFLELRFLYYNYSGGAHGNYVYRTIVFDTETGDQIGLKDICSNEEAFRSAVLSYMIRLAEEDADHYYSDRMVFVSPENESDSFSALIRDGSWYFTDRGIVFSSDIYELGPYASGICEFEIPFEVLSEWIKEKYVSRKQTDSAAQMELCVPEDGSGFGVEIIDRIVVNPEGEDLLLKVENCADEIHIYAVSYLDQFRDRTLLWYCSSVQDSAVQLRMQAPDGMPETMICYHDSDGDHSLLIQYEPGSGYSLLNEEQITSVG